MPTKKRFLKKNKTYKKRATLSRGKKSRKTSKTRKTSNPRKMKRYLGGGDWFTSDSENINPEDVCSICLEEFKNTPNKAIYITDCGHKFHNDCLNTHCETKERSGVQPGEITCPNCRAKLYTDSSDQCTDVWAFANKSLDTGKFDTKLSDIYNAQED